MINDEKKDDRELWMSWKTKAKPEKIPEPTYWPFFLAIGFTFLLWGIIAGWMILASGVLLIIISLAGWIKILRNETRRTE